MRTNFGGVDVVPLLGAIVGCHCSVLWLRGRVTTNFGGVDVVPYKGAIVVCYGWGHFCLYIDNTKIGFCYLGSMLAKLIRISQFALFPTNHRSCCRIGFHITLLYFQQDGFLHCSVAV